MGQALTSRLSQAPPIPFLSGAGCLWGVAEQQRSRGRRGRLEAPVRRTPGLRAKKPSGLSQTRDTPLSPAERARGDKL